MRSLHGLNIAGNPLDFPPTEIIEKGAQDILGFLRSMMDAKNTAKMGDLGMYAALVNIIIQVVFF